ncbi:B12-binding domain-containing radical SAM protein [Aminiphilus circumscriptus]|uniref:B12-binding domain-containing radical SAM protein n=1 Tax=Aminiphilus circumscriptus TaxID=290732 RepID=UPI000492BF28|nr:radical SAM protein [Aminiphilus circumscriptus]
MTTETKKSSRAFSKPRPGKERLLIPLKEGGDPLWALLFPASYSVGMANLGLHLVVRMLKSLGVGVERFFGISAPFFSMENGRSLGSFPIITASISYEADLLHFVKTLVAENVPLRWKDRVASSRSLVGVGGALCGINPMAFAAMADFVVLGEGETVIPFLVEETRRFLRNGDRIAFWRALASNPAFFVPPVHIPLLRSGNAVTLRRNTVSDLDMFPGSSLWTTPESVFGETFLLELQRGCFRKCSYCTLPVCYSKPRRRRMETLLDFLETCPPDVARVGLVTPEAGDYDDLDALLNALAERNKGVSFASLRVDNLTEGMLKALVKGGHTSITVAPEAANDALRRQCGKHFDNALLFKNLEMAKKIGVRKVKLYFMTGLPGETDEDLRAIGDLVEIIQGKLRLDVVLSVNTFVPKPFTPWSAQPFVGEKEAKRRLQLVKRSIRGVKGRFGCTFRPGSAREAVLEYTIAHLVCEDSERLLQWGESEGTPFVTFLGRPSPDLLPLTVL